MEKKKENFFSVKGARAQRAQYEQRLFNVYYDFVPEKIVLKDGLRNHQF